jgi:hypothetical protein
MDEVNSGSTIDFTINFTDPQGNPVTPTNVAYTVIDFFTGNVVFESLINAPPAGATSIDIKLAPPVNTIVNILYAYEMRIATFEYDYNASDTKTEDYTYKLINMVGIPMPGAG